MDAHDHTVRLEPQMRDIDADQLRAEAYEKQRPVAEAGQIVGADRDQPLDVRRDQWGRRL
jgi:hypothetical protein